ncbi:MAG: DNA cytosine methyltransferase [Myxococcota bacterium]|jgi:hypothetical protein
MNCAHPPAQERGVTSPGDAALKPLAIDLFCGLGGWTEGLLAEGYRVMGFDIEAHEYGDERYPAELVLADVLDLHGSRFADADLIVASPPCQEYSYMAMPWSLAKAKAAAIRADTTGAELERLNRLFNACFRIQREASEAAGRHIPMVVENVRGAIPWVGRSRWNFGSFHLWGDVPALMPATGRQALKAGVTHRSDGSTNFHGFKNTGGSWFNIGGPGQKVVGQNPDGRKMRDVDGYERTHPNAFGWKIPATTSKSKARKAASARIAKIPLTLSRWIAKHYRPASESIAA